MCMINSRATGAAMVSEGPAVSITPVTHCADITASQLWARTLSCSCKLAHSPSGPVQAWMEGEGPGYCDVSHIPCARARNKGGNRVKQIGLSKTKFIWRLLCNQKHMVHSTHCHKCEFLPG